MDHFSIDGVDQFWVVVDNMTTNIIAPQIYVSVLADYNSGRMHGAWIDCDQSIDEVWQEIHQLYITSSAANVTATVCQDCGHIKLYEHDICCECGSDNIKLVPSAEEYAIHDHDGFAPFDVSVYSSIEELVRMAEIISDDDKHAVSFLAGLYDDIDVIQAKIEDVEVFHCSRADYAQEITESCYDVPEYLIYYVNYDAMGRDMEINGEIIEVEHDVYITNDQEF